MNHLTPAISAAAASTPVNLQATVRRAVPNPAIPVNGRSDSISDTLETSDHDGASQSLPKATGEPTPASNRPANDGEDSGDRLDIIG